MGLDRVTRAGALAGFVVDAGVLLYGPRWLMAVWLIGWHVAWFVVTRANRRLMFACDEVLDTLGRVMSGGQPGWSVPLPVLKALWDKENRGSDGR